MQKKQMGDAASAAIITKIINDYCGTGAELARILRCHKASVSHWESSTYKVPVKHALTICRRFNIQPYLLRPDIFPQDCVISFTHFV